MRGDNLALEREKTGIIPVPILLFLLPTTGCKRDKFIKFKYSFT